MWARTLRASSSPDCTRIVDTLHVGESFVWPDRWGEGHSIPLELSTAPGPLGHRQLHNSVLGVGVQKSLDGGIRNGAERRCIELLCAVEHHIAHSTKNDRCSLR